MNNNAIVPHFDDEQDESLKIKLENVPKVENCLVATLSGYIDTYNSTYFQKRMQMAIEAGFIRLIFNCSDLNYVSSTGIGSFSAFFKTVKLKGGDLVLLEVQPKVYEVFHLLGFSQFFNIRDSLDSALIYFTGGDMAGSGSVFPKIFACPHCSQKLKAVKPGRFRCSGCKAILSVGSAGEVSAG